MTNEITDEERRKVREREQKQAGFLGAQTEAMLGSDNRYYTGLSVGHDPNKDEMVGNWFRTGAPARFREDYNRTHPDQAEPDPQT